MIFESVLNKAIQSANNSEELLEPLIAKKLLIRCTDSPQENYLITFDLKIINESIESIVNQN